MLSLAPLVIAHAHHSIDPDDAIDSSVRAELIRLLDAVQVAIGNLYFGDISIDCVTDQLLRHAGTAGTPLNELIVKAIVEDIRRRYGQHSRARLVAAARTADSDAVSLSPHALIPADAPDPVKAAAAYIQEHYAERVTWAQLSRIAHRERAGLARAFCRSTRYTVHRYLSLVRVIESLPLLAAGDKVESVALRVGWSKKSYHSQFRRIMGVTPHDYRRSRL